MSKHYTIIVDVKEVVVTADIAQRGKEVKEVNEVGKIVLRSDTKEDLLVRVNKALEAL